MFKRISLLISIVLGLTLAGTTTIHAENADKVQPTSDYVINDYAGILDDKTKTQVIQQEKAFKNTKRQPQVVVMTIKSTNGQSIADWADDLLLRKQWKFGKKGVDNGVLILFAQNGGKNNVRISTGYGVEDILTDQKTHDILESHLDDLKSQDNEKINAGIRAVDQDVNKILIKRYANTKEVKKTSGNHIMLALTLVIIIVGVILIAYKTYFNDDDDDHHNNPGDYSGRRDTHNGFLTGLTIGSIFSSGSSNWGNDNNWGNDPSWGDDNNWSDSDDWSDSGGGGDFGGGGSDV